MKSIVMLVFFSASSALAQLIPSPEFGSDVNMALLLKDYGASSNVSIGPRDAQVYMAYTGRVVATWGVPLPIPDWTGLLSLTNQEAAAARVESRREYFDLRSVRTNVAACIDATATNLNELQITTSLPSGFTAAENRTLVNALRRELIDTNQELKNALQQIQELRKCVQKQIAQNQR